MFPIKIFRKTNIYKCKNTFCTTTYRNPLLTFFTHYIFIILCKTDLHFPSVIEHTIHIIHYASAIFFIIPQHL